MTRTSFGGSHGVEDLENDEDTLGTGSTSGDAERAAKADGGCTIVRAGLLSRMVFAKEIVFFSFFNSVYLNGWLQIFLS